MKSLYIILFFLIFNSASAQHDNIEKEAAKTESYSPVSVKVSTEKPFLDAPSDAIILFDGKNLNQWEGRNRNKPEWFINDGILTVNKKAGDIITKEKFTDYQLHLEFMIPKDITGDGQARGNSGIFLAYLGNEYDGYELQIQDSYENKTYVNGQNSAICKQKEPLKNASKKPGEWQSYDPVWTAPRFDKN